MRISSDDGSLDLPLSPMFQTKPKIAPRTKPIYAPRAKPRGVLHFKDASSSSQIFFCFKIIRTTRFHELPEFFAMMKLSGMSEFMNDKVIDNMFRAKHHLRIEMERTIH